MTSHNRRNFRRRGLVSCLAIALLGLFAFAPAAMAVTAAADQYGGGGSAGGGNSGGSGGDGGGDTAGAAAGEATGGGSGSDGGTLPFSGYPVTPMVLVVAGLVAAGLAIRFVPSMAERRTARR